ncbi:MAG: hypothetical protein IPK74_01670 [Deltaproteobacteria bacterium]|nr:hypothetical protein [Deltaproteobacteria bacterium]
MSKLNVKGNVFYAPGPWGPALGVDGARVEIIDLDASGEQVIWSTTIGSNGAFAGTTSEWQASMAGPRRWVVDDPGSVYPPRAPRGHWEETRVPNPSDLLLLSARITHPAHGSVTLPFVYVGDGVTSPPLLVPPTWVPPTHHVPVPVRVDGHAYPDALGAAQAIVRAADSKHGFSLDIYEPALRDDLYRILTSSRTQLLQYIAPTLSTRPVIAVPAASVSQAWGGDDVAMVLIAIAVLVLAVGAAVFTVLVGIAIIYALSQGYRPIGAELRTDTSGSLYLHVSFGA